MSEKITINLFYMGLVASVISMLLSAVVLFQVYQQQVLTDLQLQGRMVEEVYQASGDEQTLSIFDAGSLRITLIDTDGTVLYENQADASGMDSQLSREEVQLAIEEGDGTSIRRSESMGSLEYYYALQLESGQILRVSVQATTVASILGHCALLLLPLVLVLALLAVGIAWLLTRRLLKPLSALPADMDDPDLADDPLRVYPELAPFVREIQSQRRERENMRQEFTANVTHELKTPLTSISGYAEMISTGLAHPDDIPRFAEKIRIESERMQSLVNDIIELSQLDRMDAMEPTEEVDLLGLADECSDQLSGSAEQRGVTLRVAGTGITEMGVQKKHRDLNYTQVDNSNRYIRRGGGVEIRVNPKDRSLLVRDNGIGIPEEHQGRVFERFYRVDKSHSRATGGTGLGLSIVKHIAEQHRAKISLKSTPNVGTEIRITFPQ